MIVDVGARYSVTGLLESIAMLGGRGMLFLSSDMRGISISEYSRMKEKSDTGT